MNRRTALFVIFFFLFIEDNAEDKPFVVEYKGVQIAFTEINFIEFYKCLCNPVMVHCLALTEPKAAQNITEVSVWSIRQKYGGGSADEQPLRTCEVTQSKDLNNFTINCTRSGKSTQTLSIRVVTQSFKDSCINESIKLDWSQDLRTFVNTSLIQVKYEKVITGLQLLASENVLEHNTVGVGYLIIVIILLVVAVICISAFITTLVLTLRIKNNLLLFGTTAKRVSIKPQNNGQSDYDYIGDS